MGALADQLKADMVAAMKAKDETRKNTLRMAMAAIHTAEVAGESARELSDAEELAVVAKELRSRKDSAEAYIAGGRQELADKELAEAEILAAYLPAPLTEDELRDLVAEELEAAEQASGEKPGMKQMGAVIKAVSARAEGRAEGGTIAALVRQALQG